MRHSRLGVLSILLALLSGLSAVLVAPPWAKAEGSVQVGGSGGSPYVRACPPGEVLAGVEGRFGSRLDSLSLRCVEVADDGSWSSQELHPTSFVGGEGGSGQPDPVDCPSDQFVTSLQVTYGSFVHGMTLGCRSADQLTQSTSAYFGAGGNLLTRDTNISCPAGQVAAGIAGRSGWYVDSIRLECVHLEEPYAEDTVIEAGGPEGSPYVTECRDGQHMVGVRAGFTTTLGGWLTSLQPVCSAPPEWDPQRVTNAIAAAAPSIPRLAMVWVELAEQGVASLGSRVGEPGSGLRTLLCQQDTFVQAVEVRYGSFVNGIRLRCLPLSGAALDTSGVAGSERDRRDILECPADMVAAGLVGRAGSAIDSLRLRCRRRSDRAAPRLVALLGDSYGAGEGAPDIALGGPVGAFEGSERGDRTGWVERLCHRSNRAGLARATRDYQAESPSGSEFDFRHFACAGAEIENGFIGGQSDPPEMTAALDPQIHSAERWMRSRGVDRLDTIIMSIGGNDAGFARRIADCVVQGALKDITWGVYDEACKNKASFRQAIAEETGKLPAKYANLAAALEPLNPRRVYIRTYPDVLRDRNGYCDQFQDAGERPGNDPVAGSVYDTLSDLDVETNQFIDESFVQVLNEQIVVAAREHGWIPITGWYEATSGHGYCSDDPFFNIASVAFRTQGNSGGIFHPNDRGYRADRDVTLEALRQSWLPPRPTLSLASPLPLLEASSSRPGRPSGPLGTVSSNTLRWKIEGPNTDLSKLYAELSYQVTMRRLLENGGLSTSTRLLGGYDSTSTTVDPPVDAHASEYFVRSCERALCSDWSVGLRIAHRPPTRPLTQFTAEYPGSPTASAPRRRRPTPGGVVGGLVLANAATEAHLAWRESSNLDPIEVYQTAHAAVRRVNTQLEFSDWRSEVVPWDAVGFASPELPRPLRPGVPGTVDTEDAPPPPNRTVTVPARPQPGASVAFFQGERAFFLRACNQAGCGNWIGTSTRGPTTLDVTPNQVAGLALINAPRVGPTPIAVPPPSVRSIQPPASE